MLIAGDFDHFLDGSDRHRGADAIRAGHNARAKSAVVGKPLQHVTGAAAINGAGANSTDGVPDVESGCRVGITGTDPARAHQQAADSDDQPRPEAINQVAFEGNQPGLTEDECGKCDLHRGQSRVQA